MWSRFRKWLAARRLRRMLRRGIYIPGDRSPLVLVLKVLRMIVVIQVLSIVSLLGGCVATVACLGFSWVIDCLVVELQRYRRLLAERIRDWQDFVESGSA